MTTSLGKLQIENDKLYKENTRLRDRVEELKIENYSLKKKLEKIENEIDSKITEAVNKALKKFESEEIKKLTNEINNLRERNFKLEQLLNISSDNSALPPSKDPLWKKDTTVYDERSQKGISKKIGGQEGHQKKKLEKFKEEEVTEQKNHELEKCTKCESNDLTFIGLDLSFGKIFC